MIGLVDGNNFFVSCERVFDPKLRGKPVAVLSNNDGCCISRSNEFKALGIAMGTPYFQLKARALSGELTFRSSNYELYGDMSRRMVDLLRQEAVKTEQYSIDEAFIYPPTAVNKDLVAYGKRLRAKILRWIGIPCGIGFAPTKTLAKIANHIGKKREDGVFVLPDDPTQTLAALPVEEIWGIGRHLAARLHAHGVHTAKQFRDMDDGDIRNLGSITTVKVATELRGTPCIDDRDYDADPESVSCSRSFGEPVTTLDALSESISSFTAKAAQKLREHGLVSSGANIYAQHGAARGGDWVARTVTFPHPTDATNEMLSAIRREISAIFLPGLRYRKSGMVFFGIEKANAPRQMNFFETDGNIAKRVGNQRLFKAVDALNARYGAGKVFSAAEGIGDDLKWKAKRTVLSKRATTDWNELITVK